MALNLFGYSNGTFNLAATATIISFTHSVTEWVQPCLLIGDGSNNLDGTGGPFEITTQIGSNVLQPSPDIVCFNSGQSMTAVLSQPILLMQDQPLIVKLKSPNAADTVVGVGGYLYATTSWLTAPDIRTEIDTNSTKLVYISNTSSNIFGQTSDISLTTHGISTTANNILLRTDVSTSTRASSGLSLTLNDISTTTHGILTQTGDISTTSHNIYLRTDVSTSTRASSGLSLTLNDISTTAHNIFLRTDISTSQVTGSDYSAVLTDISQTAHNIYLRTDVSTSTRASNAISLTLNDISTTVHGISSTDYTAKLNDISTTTHSIFLRTDISTSAVSGTDYSAKLNDISQTVHSVYLRTDVSTSTRASSGISLTLNDISNTVHTISSTDYTALLNNISGTVQNIVSDTSELQSKLSTMLTASGLSWTFTEDAVKNAPGGTGSTVYVNPLAVTVSAGAVSESDLTAYQYSDFSYVLGITDSTGASVDLTGCTVSFIVYKGDNKTVVFHLDTDGAVGDRVSISTNQVTIAGSDTYTQKAGSYLWVLRNDTGDDVLAKGTFTIVAVPDTPAT